MGLPAGALAWGTAVQPTPAASTSSASASQNATRCLMVIVHLSPVLWWPGRSPPVLVLSLDVIDEA